MLIDTHAHIYLDEFNEDFDNILKNTRENDIGKILLPNIDSTSLGAMNRLCVSYPDTFLQMMGLHPCSVNSDTYQSELKLVYNELNTGKYIAVGEIGIDLYWDKSTLTIQKEAFKQQIEWAIWFDLPIAIHARESFDEIFDVIKDYRSSPLKGVFHCFTGNMEQLNHILNNHPGFYFGLGGVVTFKNSGMDKIVPHIPNEKIVLETDSPYLAPVPYRGKRNEPSYILEIAQKVADLKELSLERVKEFSTKNAVELFKLKTIV